MLRVMFQSCCRTFRGLAVRGLAVRGLAVRGLAAAVAVGGGLVLGAEEPASWARFGGPGGDFRVAGLPATLPENLEPLWQIPVKGQSYGPIAADVDLVVIPDHDGKKDYFYALDPKTGKERWTHEILNDEEMDFGASPRAMPLLLEDRVIILNAWGRLRALDRADGSVLWQLDFRDKFDAEVPVWGFCSTPAIVPKGIVTNPGGSKGGMVCIDPRDGSVVWQAPTAKANYAAFLYTEIGGTGQVMTYDADGLVSVNAETGEVLWTLPVKATSGYICPAPVRIGERLLLVDQDNGARLYQLKDGVPEKKPVAEAYELAAELSTPVVIDGKIYSFFHGVFCGDADSLELLWDNSEVDAFAASAFFYPFVDDAAGRMLLYTEAGRLFLLDLAAAEMRILSQLDVAGEGQICPALVGGVLFVRDNEKGAYAYRLW